MKIIIELNEGKSLKDLSDMINELQDHLKECYDDYINGFKIEKMSGTKTVELVECDKCNARDWKIYLKPYMSQDGDGCLHCEDGTYHVYKRYEVE